MKPTLKDIALLADVSITSVSLVLNNKPNNLTDKTKKRIRHYAKELNYRPNKIAQSLKSSTSNIIGLIIPDLSNPYFSKLSKNIRLKMKQTNYLLLTFETDDFDQNESDFIDVLLSYNVSGVVYIRPFEYSPAEHNQTITALKDNRIPFVVLDSLKYSNHFNTVNIDNELGGYLATQHLIELGHTKIGCYSGPHHVESSKLRIAGYKKALEEAALPSDYIFEGNYGLGLEMDALDYFILQDCTAVFALNDMMALGLYKAARKKNIEIPDQLSVVGFDNIDLGEIIYPELTTVDQSMDSLVERAVAILEQSINGETAIQSSITKPKLVIRNSTRAY